MQRNSGDRAEDSNAMGLRKINCVLDKAEISELLHGLLYKYFPECKFLSQQMKYNCFCYYVS
jgi:hypothetical protein